MKIELRMANITKSIIDQITYVKPNELMNIHKVYGWVNMRDGLTKSNRVYRLIILETNPGEIRKMKMFTTIHVDNLKDPDLSKPPTGYFVVTVEFNLFKPNSYRFETEAEVNIFTDQIQMIKRLANQQGQFFI